MICVEVVYNHLSLSADAGTAYIHGMKHATGNFIILMDADLSHHVSGVDQSDCRNITSFVLHACT